MSFTPCFFWKASSAGDATVTCDADGCDTNLFGVRDRFRFASTDEALTLRIFVDPVAVEAFAMQGRVASTGRRGGAATALTLSVASDLAGAAADARVFALDSIYGPGPGAPPPG